MKYVLAKQVTIGLLASVMVAGPVFAETTTTVSDSISMKKKPSVTSEKKDGIPGVQDQGSASPTPNRLNLPPREAPTPGQGIGVSAEEQQEIAPYFNQILTKVSIEGNEEIPSEEIHKVLVSKPGLPLTEEDVTRDLQAIYAMGWFYDLSPSFARL